MYFWHSIIKKMLHNTHKILIGMASALLFAACANVGNPSGGPRDEDPPYLISANPGQGARDVKRTRLSLTFNEIVNVKDAFQKVVVSPAARPPKVSANGRRVTIDFDSLRPNTTYTIDFADAIEDNTESNKLRNFAYTFSTGPDLDTLRIAGRVLGSRDLEPRPGMLVGVHRNLPDSVMIADSIFMKTPLLRVAKADDRGRFVIRGLAPGDYRVFALMDNDGDFMFSSDQEEMGFYDVAVTPYTESTEAIDSIYNKLGQVDTVIRRQRTRYLPNDVLLRTFVSNRRPQYVARSERNDSNRLFIKLNAPMTKLPSMRILGQEGKFPGIIESRPELDSITVWLPKELASRDSVMMAIDYTRLERGKAPAQITDTLKFIRKRMPVPKKKKKERKLSVADSLALITTSFKIENTSGHEVWDVVRLEAPTPLVRLDTTKIHLQEMKDSVWIDVKGPLKVYRPDSVAPRILAVDYNWDYDRKYKLVVDTLAGTDIYGLVTRPLEQEITTKAAADYCTLTLNITGMEQGVPAFAELLDTSDKVVRTAVVQNGRAFFPFLAAGKYYVRLIEDYNGNGVYDTGDYETGLQPDLAYYYPKVINIKKNWDKEEAWDLFGTAIDMMKPQAILKNKPEQDKRSRAKKGDKEEEYDEEDEDYFDPTANPFDPNDRQRRRERGRLR